MSGGGELTYFTVADDKYFLGAVALVNSLRLSGNQEPIVVMDAGLTVAQKSALAAVCEIRPVPLDPGGTIPAFLKPTAYRLGLDGTIVFLDSDMIVTSRLRPFAEEAVAGKICIFPDEPLQGRRFAEWWEALDLQPHKGDRVYVNTGFVALRVDRWESLLRRWWELCDRVREERSRIPWEDQGKQMDNPFAFADQDVLNALLMAEVPEESIHYLDANLVPSLSDPAARIVDRARLRCDYRSRETMLLHYWWFPKPWLANDSRDSVLEAYVELMARLLTAPDVAVRLEPLDVPVWLRTGVVGRLVRRGPRRARRIVKGALRLLPNSLEQAILSRLGAIARKVRLG